ncbi:MAG: histidine phosphatase family protein [Rhodospirillales bacterium]|nr:histidine phosphatase family protein [Rhodospirillales bacterium]
MHQLLLLRHAKAAPAAEDHERPLTEDGQLAAHAQGAAMRALGLIPDLILVSSARRTRETLAALEPFEEMPLIETMAELYLAEEAALFDHLRAVAETVRSVLLIGHNPGLHHVALRLAGADAGRLIAGFPTATLAEFTLPPPWSRSGAGTGARLIRLLTPPRAAP